MIVRLFTRIAAGYDRMNRLMSLGRDRVWRSQGVTMVGGSPKVIVDLACGTGDLTSELCRRFSDARVIGIDATPVMLERARLKLGPDRVDLRVGDAQDFSSSLKVKADLVACAFGFRNFPDKAVALGECARVLRPGGELLVVEFFRPASWLLARLTSLWLTVLAYAFARCAVDAYRYLGRSMETTCTEGEFVRLARQLGFVRTGRRFFFPCCTCLTFVRRPDLI